MREHDPMVDRPSRSASVPRVGIVVINYHAAELTLALLARLERLTWPRECLVVAVVDNGSEAGFDGEVRARFPDVRFVAAPSNLGVAGGANTGIRALLDCDLIALLNNDTAPEPGWLEPLVEKMQQTAAGAVTPKVLLDGRFVRVGLQSPTTQPGGGDPRDLGVQLCGARVDGVDVSDRIELVRGFWGWEEDKTTVGGTFAWTTGDAVAHLPVDDGSSTPPLVELRLACGTGPTTVSVTVDRVPSPMAIGVRPEWCDIGAVPLLPEIVNNAGAVLLEDGGSADRGYLEPDDGRFDVPCEVFGFSAAAVLLSRAFLDDVGPLDERFFLYYEDTDLSWRGRLRGWTYWYEPASVVRHQHSATVGSRSSLARHLSARNRLLVLTKSAPQWLVRRAVGAELADLGRAIRRDVVGRLLLFRRPVTRHTASELRVLAGYVRLLPGALVDRRRIRGRATVPDAALLAWASGDRVRGAI
jgi:GT2 family glycosyltransferase